MNGKTSLRYYPKIVLWISFCFIVLTCIIITTDSLGYILSVLKNNKQLVENKSAFRITSKTEVEYATKIRKNASTHIAFLKVHKAGSTTIQNLFFRFGLSRNLNILLPKSGNYLMSAEQKIPLKAGEHYDIFACHTVYQKQWFDSLLPADSVNIGIVREPISRVISAAYYYRNVFRIGYLTRIPRANFIHYLVNFPEKYNAGFFSLTRNSMGRDFGFQRDIQQTDKSQIRQYLDQLNSQFILVLIMEKFDESLVMMKRILNWTFRDIIYLETNSHQHSFIVLNTTEKAKLKNTCFLDFDIYEYFSEVFEMKLKQNGEDIYDEVSFYKTVLEKVRGFCLNRNGGTMTLSIQTTKWDDAFHVTKSDCKLMQTKELPFISKLRSKYLE